MYLLDANAFIEASRLYYGFDIAPGFWGWLGDPSLAGQVGSVGAVRDELKQGTGDLVAWTREQPNSLWHADTAEVVAAMTQLSTWATDPTRTYQPQAVDKFLASADYTLIAHAVATGAVVVTREQPAPDSRRAIKIPDVCDAFGVAWTDPFSMYRGLGLRLVS